jgi:hypothetical protein
MNRRNVIVLVVLIATQLLIVFGVALAMRLQYPESARNSTSGSWVRTPTAMINFNRSTPMGAIQSAPIAFQAQPCTYASEYLMNHVAELEALGIEIRIGDQEYSPSQAVSIIIGEDRETFRNLFLQLYTAKVNILLGADDSLIEIEISQADSWVSDYSPEESMAIEEMQQAVMLTNILRDFNSGRIGPGLCTMSLSAMDATPTALLIFLSSVTLTPATTETPTSSQTFTSTATPYKRTYTLTPKYSITPTKTGEPDLPIQTTSPTAQNTRVPPTQPSPTITPNPPTITPDTPTNTPKTPTDTTEPPPITVEPTDESTPTLVPTKEPTPTLVGP